MTRTTAVRVRPAPASALRRCAALATCGVSGTLIFFAAVLGYSLGGGLILTAVLKPLFPGHVGLFSANGSLWSIGFTTPPPGAHELLGPFYLGAALTAGPLTMAATYLLIQRTSNAAARLRSRLSWKA